MSESDLIDHLRAALDDSAAGLRAPRDAAARARTKGRRRRGGRVALAGVPAVALAAGAAVVLTSTGGGPAGPAVAAGPAAQPAITVAYVARHVQAALGGISTFIVESTAVSNPGQTTTTDEDLATGMARNTVSGTGHRATWWLRTTVTGDRDVWHYTYVDFTTRTWWAKTSHSGLLGHVAPGAPPALATDTDAAQIRQAFRSGQLTLAGRGQVNGHAAIELEYATRHIAQADQERYWVDAQTFRPVQLDLPPFGPANTINESWLRRVPALVHAVNVPRVPAGFRQVPPAPGWN
jgi:hypothetical protein